jgi:hypothetical protein
MLHRTSRTSRRSTKFLSHWNSVLAVTAHTSGKPWFRRRVAPDPVHALKLTFLALFVASRVSSLAFAQAGAPDTPPNWSNMAPGLSSNSPVQSVGPANIPLGSTELATAGESPVILPLGGTLVTGKGPPGASGIPLRSTELRNPGLTAAPQIASANDCTGLRYSRIATTISAGILPSRLFDGRAGMASLRTGTAASTGCMRYGLSPTQQGMASQQGPMQGAAKSGISQGATELMNGGLSRVIPVRPVTQASPLSEGY